MKLMSSTARSLAVAATLALLASGCSDDAGDQTNTTGGTPSPTGTPPTQTPPGTSPSADASGAPAVSAVDAHDAALETVQGDVLAIDLEDDSSRWEVLVRGTDGSGTEVWVDSASGDVLEERAEDVPDEARDGAPAFTAQEAMEAAQAAVTGTTVSDLDIDSEGGTAVWEVVVEAEGVETDLQIDATSGEVLQQEQDD